MASERLRAYVRERVKPTGKHYQRGNAAALAEHLAKAGLGEDAAWISAYADPDAKPRRNADIDVALAICEFYGVNLADFAGATSPVTGSDQGSGSHQGGSDVPASAERARLREITRLGTEIARLETQLLQVRNGARDLAKLATVRGKSAKATRRRA